MSFVAQGQNKFPRPDRCIQDLFTEQAERAPAALAVVIGDRELTYGELNRRANQLGNYLRELGVGPEVQAGVCLDRSLEMVVGLLGILKAGGAYVPLDPTYPAERISFMLNDAQVSVVLTQTRWLQTFSMQPVKAVALDSEWERIRQVPDRNPKNQNTADSLAYVMYTSGSTGQPKGVSVPHRGVVRLVKETN